jgi:cytochrome b6-f complex iron-sulfur subunit
MTTTAPGFPTESSRRAFCVRTCQAVSLAAVASLLEACGANPASPSAAAPSLATVTATVTGGVVSLTVDGASPLAAIGSAALVQASTGNYLVARSAQDAFVAVTAVCTHQGCTITGHQDQTYVCPCHGSQFNTNGGVVSGPAVTALRRFTTQFVGSVLTFTA